MTGWAPPNQFSFQQIAHCAAISEELYSTKNSLFIISVFLSLLVVMNPTWVYQLFWFDRILVPNLYIVCLVCCTHFLLNRICECNCCITNKWIVMENKFPKRNDPLQIYDLWTGHHTQDYSLESMALRAPECAFGVCDFIIFLNKVR